MVGDEGIAARRIGSPARCPRSCGSASSSSIHPHAFVVDAVQDRLGLREFLYEITTEVYATLCLLCHFCLFLVVFEGRHVYKIDQMESGVVVVIQLPEAHAIRIVVTGS